MIGSGSGGIRLIVNGDDFGASEEVNEGIIRAYREGILTSCSLMVAGEAFDQAVRLARENKGLAVGIHLVTVMGRSVLSPAVIPTLVDRDGNFPNDPTAAGFKYYFSGRARRELRKELSAQFEKFALTGLEMSHIDSHLHMHIHPVIFNIAIELGERYGVRRMRVPEDELIPALRFERSRLLSKAAYALIFMLLTKWMKGKLKARGFTFAEQVYGNFLSGRMSERYVLFVLDHLAKRTNEIYFHPTAYGGDELPSGSALERGRNELDILTSSRVTARVKELGITLTDYRAV